MVAIFIARKCREKGVSMIDVYKRQKEEFDALAKRLNTPVEPADDEQAVAIAAASEANKTAWVKAGTYKISVNGKEFLVELEKEVVRFR